MTPMTPDAHWRDLTAQHLVRYEALFKLLDDIQALEDIPAIAQQVATQWKYFAGVAAWRMVIAAEPGFVLIDGARGQAQISQVPSLPAWDRSHWDAQRPHVLRPVSPDAGMPEHLANKAVVEIEIQPFLRGGLCIALLSAAARHGPFSDLDRKFIRLFGGHLADRLSAILLRRRAMELLIGRATHDALTGILNRGAILERLAAQWAQSTRSGQPTSVVLIDIDHFKRVNDRLGHQAGDAVLCEVTRRLTGQVRHGDNLGRYGGEEFLVVLYPCSAPEALAVAERFRHAIADTSVLPVVAGGPPLSITISLGAASAIAGPELSIEGLLRQADEALYRAKERGRNRVEPQLQAGSN
jgi:diguanylate cyclase (GGDEF)-like protein